jgi:HEAT repeat protein
METRIELDDLIKRAGGGDAPSAMTVLRRLASGDHHEQFAALEALNPVAESSFWYHVLEFLATGRWGGVTTREGKDTSFRQALKPKGRALFVAAPSDEPAGLARKEALLHGIASNNPRISRLAIDLAGGTKNKALVASLIAVLEKGRGQARLQAAHAIGRLPDESAVPALIAALQSDDELFVGLAKDALVEIGAPAVLPLATILSDSHSSEQIRWMAARALVRIADPRAIPALVAGLHDSNSGVRWLCADALIHLRSEGLRAVLHALATQPITPWLADAAGHVLGHDLANRDIVKSVVQALHGADANVMTPIAAEHALRLLDEAEKSFAYPKAL